MNPVLVKAVIASSRAATSRVIARRGLHSTRAQLEATVFKMPAMSPTMTEGGIVDWKFKEGDSFNQGDVLLEIETDKAQIDVEAQEDGKLAKIYAENGAKGIQVGDGIAVTAEPDDDLSSLEIPSAEQVRKTEEAAPAAPESEAKEPSEAPAKEEQSTTPKKQQVSSSSSGGKANPDQTLLPSVQGLIHANGISKGDALDKIPASGPNGRLLKGDVLAYLGTISQESVTTISDNIKKLQHLDLSNIKIKEPQPEKDKSAGEAEKSAAETKTAAPEPLVLRGTISLTEVNLLKATAESTYQSEISVQHLVDKASKLAARDVPLLSKPKPSVLNDPVFDSLVSPSRTSAKPYTVEISYPNASSSSFSRAAGAAARTGDIYDILASPKRPVGRPVGRQAPELINVAVKVNEKVPGSEAKAQLYLDRLNYYLTNGKGDLVL